MRKRERHTRTHARTQKNLDTDTQREENEGGDVCVKLWTRERAAAAAMWRNKENWKQLGKGVAITYGVIAFAWWWDSNSPLGWWTLKPRTKEEREMAHLYERRVFPYPGDKEAVQEFIEKGGAYGTTIGSHDVRQKAKDNRVADLQKERFEREAQKLWLRMQNEVLREFHEQGFSLTATSETE
jgi:hypothetical protein